MLTGGSLSGNAKASTTPPNNFMNIQDSQYLKWAPARTVEAADRLVELKNNKDPWEVFAEVVKVWQGTHPADYESFLFNLDVKKGTAKVTSVGNKQFRGVSVDTEGSVLRHRLDIPVKVIYMIRKLYPEMNLDADFYKKWGKKFPHMVIEEAV